MIDRRQMNIENVHQMLIILDDTVLEEHHVSPSLVQMSLIGEGGEEALLVCLQPFVCLFVACLLAFKQSTCFFKRKRYDNTFERPIDVVSISCSQVMNIH